MLESENRIYFDVVTPNACPTFVVCCANNSAAFSSSRGIVVYFNDETLDLAQMRRDIQDALPCFNQM